MRAIGLVNNRGIAIVDDEDFTFLSRFRWYLVPNGVNEYAKTFDVGGVFMHQLIMELPPPPLVVCHLDDVGTHNFRSNLKIASQSENIGSAHDKIGRNHGLPRGILLTAEGTYRVRITLKGKRLSLGCFRTLEEAIEVYKNKQNTLWENSQWRGNSKIG